MTGLDITIGTGMYDRGY